METDKIVTEQMSTLRTAFRWIGGYATVTVALLFLFAATAPNGTDGGVHLMLGLLVSLLIALPFVLAMGSWLVLEVTRYRRFEYDVESMEDN